MPEAVRQFDGLTGVNNYVPAMAYSAGMVHSQPTAFSLGTPALADDDLIAAAVDGDAVAGTVEAYDWTADSPYGRNVVVTVSADPGAAGSVVEVNGFDYLGQPMTERYTTANGSTAAQVGKKAFYRVTGTKIVTAATNAITLKVGTGAALGLPYKGVILWAKTAGALVAVSGATIAIPVETDPQTATTGDPRGTYTAAATLDGIKEIVVGLVGDNSVNAAGNGGLHGIQQFAA